MRIVAISLVMVGVLGGYAVAADQILLGRTFQVKDGAPGVDATKRKVVGLAKEKASPNFIVGDPTAGGATLQVIVDGGSPSSQSFALPQGLGSTGKPFWKATGTGFVYKDSLGDQGAVKTLVIKRSASGNFVLKAVLLGKGGPITVLPPNPGTEAFVTLDLSGGDRYCMQYGGAVGGLIKNVGNKLFKVTKVPAEGGCPIPPSTTSTSTTTTISTSTSSVSTSTSTSTSVTTITNSTSTSTSTSTSSSTSSSSTSTSTSTSSSSTSTSTSTTLCSNQQFTFDISSNNGGSVDPAEWPGGTLQGTQSGSCFTRIDVPSGNIDVVGNIGDDFSVLSQSGFSNCFGNGGEDGDGCSVLSCPPAGVGSCESARPSCSAALNGTGSARYVVQCLQ